MARFNRLYGREKETPMTLNTAQLRQEIQRRYGEWYVTPHDSGEIVAE